MSDSALPPAAGAAGYYGLPLLKAPVWTWEVPAYFFIGGTAGAAAVVGEIANATGAARDLVTHARWIAAAGAAASPLLLISDLGRPDRFLNMLRVVKLQSPMSVGAWTLVTFSSASAASAFADLLHRTWPTRGAVRIAGNAAGLVAAASGVVLATYTGVLIGATAIPVWSRNVGLLPLHFGASGLAAAAALLELLGHRDRALTRIAASAAALESLVGLALETQDDDALEPLKAGRSGTLIRVGGVLSGPLPLAVRLLGRSRRSRQAAAACALAGSLLTRAGWLAAGRVSAETSTP